MPCQQTCKPLIIIARATTRRPDRYHPTMRVVDNTIFPLLLLQLPSPTIVVFLFCYRIGLCLLGRRCCYRRCCLYRLRIITSIGVYPMTVAVATVRRSSMHRIKGGITIDSTCAGMTCSCSCYGCSIATVVGGRSSIVVILVGIAAAVVVVVILQGTIF